MTDDTFPVRWIGQQAVLTLPEHVDYCNADQVREQLLWIIDCGAAVLIADLTGTVSCDYSGAYALARAQHRATASGAELRLAATGDLVRHVLCASEFDCPIPLYPDLEAAVAAPADSGRLHCGEESPAEDRAARGGGLLGLTAETIVSAGAIVQAATGPPPGVTAPLITEAHRRLDEAVREICNHLLAERDHDDGPGLAGPPSPVPRQRSASAMTRSALLQRHIAQTARAVQVTAADTAALLEQRADFLSWHAHLDYPTEIKQWRVLADQAGQIAERWQQQS